MSKHVAVLMGGWSAEREISLRSGKACAEALRGLGYRVTRIDVGRDIASVLSTVKPDIALNVSAWPPGRGWHVAGHIGDPRHPLHPFRRDGFCGCHAEGDSKERSFVRPSAGARRHRCYRAWRRPSGICSPPPYVIKPLAEGSSVGVFIVAADHAHPPQELTRPDWEYGEQVMVEMIPGKELTCAVMGKRGARALSRSCRRRNFLRL